MSTIKNLSPEQSENLRQSILKRESSGNYQAVNQLGYVGGYQFGAPALEDLGYIKKGASKGGNAALNNPANWNNPPGSKEAFLNNPSLQDRAFVQLSNRNITTMEKIGVLEPGADPSKTAGYTATAHLLGPGGARDLKNGVVKTDANGTKATEYYKLGAGSASGAPGSPPAGVPSTGAAATTGATPTSAPASSGAGYVPSPLPKVKLTTEIPDAGPVPNPLSEFKTFNNIFTLSALTKEEVNNPDETYKIKVPQNIVLRSGGGFPERRIQTDSGQFEYYIDNIDIDSLMSMNPKTQSTNAAQIAFEVIEPYSLGTFLESLQLAAETAGQANYASAPFLLTIEFIGWQDSDRSEIVPLTTRHFPIQLKKVELEVTAAGSRYSVQAIPWNEVAMSDLVQTFKTDVSITGDTVQKMLQDGEKSLQAQMNSILKKQSQEGEKKKVPDQILILFPKILNSASSASQTGGEDRGATTASTTRTSSVQTKLGVNSSANQGLIQSSGSVNEIGESTMGFNMVTGGDQPATEENKAALPGGVFKRNQVIIDPKKREFKFDQGSSITNAITQTVLMSDFGRKLIEQQQDENDMLTWFRIETKVYDLDRDEQTFKLQGRDPRLYVFQVVPYKVHASRFLPPNITQQFANLKKQTVKRYQYIYTGANTEILDFQIRFNSAFFVTTAPDINGAGNQDAKNQLQQGAGGEVNTKPVQQTDGESNSDSASSQQRVEKQLPPSRSGGGATDDHKTRIAKQFQEALYDSPSDMVQVNMTIMGDPYFIADSGMGNFSNTGTGGFNITKTGAVDYQSGEVDILVEFRTPVDIDPVTGYMSNGASKIVKDFSGIFQVTRVRNVWQQNKFTQELSILRRRNQDAELAKADARAAKEKEAADAQRRADTQNQSAAETARLNRQATQQQAAPSKPKMFEETGANGINSYDEPAGP